MEIFAVGALVAIVSAVASWFAPTPCTVTKPMANGVTVSIKATGDVCELPTLVEKKD